MLFYVLNREMNAVATMSNDVDGTMYIDDTSGGQTITLTNGCAIGSYDFKTDPYHKDSVYITAGNFIAFNDKYNRTRLYTIMTVDGDDELDVHCEDIGLDLINEMANAWSYNVDQTLDFYLNQVIGNSSWKVVYDTEGLSSQTRHLTFDNNTDTKLTRLESIMSGFGFECDFQITMEWMTVKSMEIHVYSKLQNRSETDVVQRFVDSVNLVSLNRSESIEDLYTAVLPTGGTANGKTVDISDIVYDDGQYFTTKGDNKLYDRKYGEKWNRYVGTSDYGSGSFDYIVGHYSSSTTSSATLFDEALSDLKSHHDVKLAYEAELLDLNADLGDYIEIVDHTKQTDVHLRARIQEVTNYYTQAGCDTGTLANYTIMSTTNGDTIRQLLNQISAKVSSLATTVLYFTLDTQGVYAPVSATWSEFKPSEIPEGQYMWIKTVATYMDGTQAVTYTATKDQIDYVGPETVVKQTTLYFLSTSSAEPLKDDGTAATDDDWSETQPAYEFGKYFWKRDKVEWSGGTIDYTWSQYDQQMTEAYQKVSQAQDTANTAASSANDAQNTANTAAENVLQNSADISIIQNNLNTVTTVADLAKQQADAAQTDIDNFKTEIDQGLNARVSKIESQVVIANDKGIQIKSDTNSSSYIHLTNEGMDIYYGKQADDTPIKVATFKEETEIKSLIVRNKFYVGNHIVEAFTVGGEAGTAFFWHG